MALPDESEFCVPSVVSRGCVQRDDLRRRLDSKSPLGTYMQRLFDSSSLHMLANPYTVRSLLNHMAAISRMSEYADDEAEEIQRGRIVEMQNTSDLLILLAKYFPSVRNQTPPRHCTDGLMCDRSLLALLPRSVNGLLLFVREAGKMTLVLVKESEARLQRAVETR